mgnify:CR=1 FL=1
MYWVVTSPPRPGIERADAVAGAQDLGLGDMQRLGNGAVLLPGHAFQKAVHNLQRDGIRADRTHQLQPQALFQVSCPDTSWFHALQQTDAKAHILLGDSKPTGDRLRRLGEEAVFIQRLNQIIEDAVLPGRQFERRTL